VQLLSSSNATTDNKAAPQSTKPAVGEGLVQRGPLLITKQGMSGPAVLKLSAFGARLMSDAKYRYGNRCPCSLHFLSVHCDVCVVVNVLWCGGYRFAVEVSWLGDLTSPEVLSHLQAAKQAHPNR
jgi:hypothetical protein